MSFSPINTLIDKPMDSPSSSSELASPLSTQTTPRATRRSQTQPPPFTQPRIRHQAFAASPEMQHGEPSRENSPAKLAQGFHPSTPVQQTSQAQFTTPTRGVANAEMAGQQSPAMAALLAKQTEAERTLQQARQQQLETEREIANQARIDEEIRRAAEEQQQQEQEQVTDFMDMVVTNSPPLVYSPMLGSQEFLSSLPSGSTEDDLDLGYALPPAASTNAPSSSRKISVSTMFHSYQQQPVDEYKTDDELLMLVAPKFLIDINNYPDADWTDIVGNSPPGRHVFFKVSPEGNSWGSRQECPVVGCQSTANFNRHFIRSHPSFGPFIRSDYLYHVIATRNVIILPAYIDGFGYDVTHPHFPASTAMSVHGRVRRYYNLHKDLHSLWWSTQDFELDWSQYYVESILSLYGRLVGAVGVVIATFMSHCLPAVVWDLLPVYQLSGLQTQQLRSMHEDIEGKVYWNTAPWADVRFLELFTVSLCYASRCTQLPCTIPELVPTKSMQMLMALGTVINNTLRPEQSAEPGTTTKKGKSKKSAKQQMVSLNTIASFPWPVVSTGNPDIFSRTQGSVATSVSQPLDLFTVTLMECTAWEMQVACNILFQENYTRNITRTLGTPGSYTGPKGPIKTPFKVSKQSTGFPQMFPRVKPSPQDLRIAPNVVMYQALDASNGCLSWFWKTFISASEKRFVGVENVRQIAKLCHILMEVNNDPSAPIWNMQPYQRLAKIFTTHHTHPVLTMSGVSLREEDDVSGKGSGGEPSAGTFNVPAMPDIVRTRFYEGLRSIVGRAVNVHSTSQRLMEFMLTPGLSEVHHAYFLEEPVEGCPFTWREVLSLLFMKHDTCYHDEGSNVCEITVAWLYLHGGLGLFIDFSEYYAGDRTNILSELPAHIDRKLAYSAITAALDLAKPYAMGKTQATPAPGRQLSASQPPQVSPVKRRLSASSPSPRKLRKQVNFAEDETNVHGPIQYSLVPPSPKTLAQQDKGKEKADTQEVPIDEEADLEEDHIDPETNVDEDHIDPETNVDEDHNDRETNVDEDHNDDETNVEEDEMGDADNDQNMEGVAMDPRILELLELEDILPDSKDLVRTHRLLMNSFIVKVQAEEDHTSTVAHGPLSKTDTDFHARVRSKRDTRTVKRRAFKKALNDQRLQLGLKREPSLLRAAKQ